MLQEGDVISSSYDSDEPDNVIIDYDTSTDSSSDENEKDFHMIAKKVFLTYSQANFLDFDILKKRLLDNNVSCYVFSQENHKDVNESTTVSDDEIDDEIDNEVDNEIDNEIDNILCDNIIVENVNIDSDKSTEVDFELNKNSDTEIDNEPSAGIHFHCYLEFLVKIDIRDCTYFDIITTTDTGNEITYHPNIQYVRSKRACIIYIKKDGNWISNEESKFLEVCNLDLKAQVLKWIYDQGETHKARFWLDVWENRTRKRILDSRVNMPDFKWWRLIPKHTFAKGFASEGRPKALYLFGEPETGKTLWISQFFKDEPKFYCGDWKQFNLYRNERIIVFEDFMPENFKNMTGFFKTAITDTYIDVYTPSFYTSHKLNEERTIIFSSNVNPQNHKFFDKALLSRLVIINSEYELFDKVLLKSKWENLVSKFLNEESIPYFP